MNKVLLAATIGLSIMTQQTQAAEIKAFVTGAAKRSFATLGPEFERSSGHKLAATLDLPPTLIKKIDAGEPFDVIILSDDVAGLIKQGKVVADTRTVFGRVGVGVAVQKGAPKPDFSTVEAFKKSLLNAKSFATSGRGLQRALRRFPDREARHRRAGQAEDPLRRSRRFGGHAVARRGGFRGLGPAAIDRHAQYRVARLFARGDQQLAGVQRRRRRQRQGTAGRAGAAQVPDGAWGDGGVQGQRLGTTVRRPQDPLTFCQTLDM